MSEDLSTAAFFEANRQARAWAALDEATNQQLKVTAGPVQLQKKQFAHKRALVLGAGVGGLTTAYELLAQESGMEVTVLEAQPRTGGRCLSLRTGDTLTEDINSKLFESEPGETQTVRFSRPIGDSEPYLNAGPGRIPSHHKRLLGYLRRFGVPVEVYVMNTESNLVQMSGGPFDSEPVVYRRLDHNVRGWLAEMVYEKADELLPEGSEQVDALRDLMIKFGELSPKGCYAPTAGEPGFENARSRAGFTVLPGVDAGTIADPLPLDMLLSSRFWRKTRFYQPSDFLWQPTLFQPVGGMDQVQRAFARKVATLGGTIHLNSPVRSIDWDPSTREYVVRVDRVGESEPVEFRADYCFSNIAMPFLSRIVSSTLQGSGDKGFDPDFKAALHAVYDAQFGDDDVEDDGAEDDDFEPRFLANTTKVGWQADRSLWQGSPFEVRHDDQNDADVLNVPDSELGVVPIFGGISWTDHEIVQIWYPSTGYHDTKGVLTGAYNFGAVAKRWGELSVQERLDMAQEGARLFNEKFGDGLKDGVAIAWQNIPFIKGGWAQWHTVGSDAVSHFNVLSQGSGVADDDGTVGEPTFFIVGDQISSLPGWQEGAIASALNAVSRMARPDLAIPHLSALPDTRLMVEGI